METLTTDQIREIITPLREEGLQVGLRDVAYAVLSIVYIGGRETAFRSVFGDAPEIPYDKYIARPETERVLQAVCAALAPTEAAQESSQEITFDDLKQGLIDDMRALEELRDKRTEDGGPMLEPKEMAQVVARIADIRVKLSEKFNTSERVVEQRVIVEQKYNAVCACGREIYIPEGGVVSELPNQRQRSDNDTAHYKLFE